MLYIYTDGSCKKNPNGPGGFGVVVVELEPFQPENEQKLIKCFSESEDSTTNNRQEMKAILWALEEYGKSNDAPIVYSDSSYSINTFTKWMWGWKNNGWKRGNNRQPENLDLVQLYDILTSKGYRISLQQIKGHSGILWNEVADQLATGRITPEKVMEKYSKKEEILSEEKI